MTAIPDMPDDFWPEVMVIGKSGNIELAFALTSRETAIASFEPCLDALRRAIWQAKHDETCWAGIQKLGSSFREIKQGIKDGTSVP